MRKLIVPVVAGLIAVSAASTVSAAEISMPLPLSFSPAPQRFAAASWSGVYVGVHAGYGMSQTFERTFTGGNANVPADNAFLGGLQMGINYQFSPKWVVGLETDISWGGPHGSRMDPLCGAPFCVPPIRTLTEVSIDWQGTTRVRLGYLPYDHLMVYGTAGVAYGSVTTSMKDKCKVPASCPFSMDSRDSSIGWTAGAGFEYALLSNWSLKVEYLHVELEGPKVNFPGGWTRSGLSEDIVRVGLNFRFSS